MSGSRALSIGLALSGVALPALGGALQSEPRGVAPIGLQERIACQHAIEETYWRHRIWPDANPGPKPPLSALLSEAGLRHKVEDALSKSRALATMWGRPITPAQLRAEIEQMARNTRNPQMLGELWGALGKDPTLVAECLARPLIADRLIRDWYGFDDRIHGELRKRVRSDLDVHRTVQGMRAMSGRYEQQVWRRGVNRVGSAPDTRTSAPVRVLGEDEWLAEMARLRELYALDGESSAGDRDALPVRKISSIQEDERQFQVHAVLEMSPESLTLATMTWPKRTFDDWWEENASAFPPALPVGSVQAKPLPAIAPPGCTDDTWDATPFSPWGRDMHVMVWTGAEVLIWGGFVEPSEVPGGRYDLATGTWRPIGWVNQPTLRQLATAVWTGTEMIVWGGWGGGDSYNFNNAGGRYDPVTDAWTPTSVAGAAPVGRWRHSAVWTGSEMIVWGGCPNLLCSPTLDTGGKYDPQTDSWSPVVTAGAPAAREYHTAVWSVSEMIVWGGQNSGAIHRDGGRYDPATDSWSALALEGAPEARSLHSAVWTGTEMIVWGGCRSSACFYPLFDSGGRYDPVADAWRPTSTTGAPYQRRHHTAVWTGQEMIIWGGCVDADCSDFRDSGGRYDPQADAWIPTSTTNSPYARAMHTAVWTGAEMVIWGGCLGGECEIELAGGGRYSPATDSWVPIGGSGSPFGRIYYTAVWTGAEMIVWGGVSGSQMRHGKRYDTATNRWTSVTDLGAPAERAWHSAVWTGTEMIVWGGSPRTGSATTGGRYDPTTDSWIPTSTSGAPEARTYHTAVWTGAEMIVWGGLGSVSAAAVNTGGRYDPATDSWTPTSTVNAPSGRFDHSEVWTGSGLIVWGGAPDFPWTSPPTATGGRYSPATDSWAATSLSGAPGARRQHSGVWTGSELIVWGGEAASGFLGDGGRYDPTSDAWSPVSLLSAPLPRRDHTAVWTGSKMMVWGGESGLGLHADGGRYDPAGDFWSPTSLGAFVPAARALHTAVWTGTEAIIWGGRGDDTGYTDTGARYCATEPAGAGPGSVDGLTVMDIGGALRLTWNPSCSGGATDYAVYQGVIGDWTSHTPYLCSTGGATSVTMAAGAGDLYFLIVPLDGASEGSYGTDWAGAERAPSASACIQAQSLGTCP